MKSSARHLVRAALAVAALLTATASLQAAPAAGSKAPAAGTRPAAPATAPVNIEIIRLTAQPVLTRRVTAKPAELEGLLRTAIFAMLAEAGASGLELAGPPFVRYLARGEVWDVEAGVPVIKAPATAPSAATRIGTLPAGEAATFVHVGPLNQLPAAHDTLARWVAQQKRRPAGAGWEVYLTNPVTTRDPARQRAKLFLPVEPAAPAKSAPARAAAGKTP